MTHRTTHWALILILVLYLALGLAYSMVMPILEGPDELLNYENLRFFAEQRRLPVLREGELSKGHQAPLYYALGAVLTGWVPNDQLVDVVSQGNPFWAYRHWLTGVDNKAQYLHDSSLEGLPYRDVSLGVHLMRWISLLMGAGVVAIIYAIARVLFFDERWLAPGVAALVAFNPMFLHIQTSLHNDSLTNLLAAALILAVVLYWTRGPSNLRAAGLGLLCGLGIMTKITFLFLVPMVAVAMIWRSWLGRRSNDRCLADLVRLALTAAGVTLLVSGWWFVRNWIIYGEPTSMGLQSQVWGVRPGAPDFRAAYRELGFLFDSFWGAFGFGQLTLPSWIYRVLAVVEWVAVGGLMVWLVRSWRRGWNYRVLATLLGALAVGPITAFAATFGRMMMSPTADFGRYLFTASGVIVPFLALGLTEWFPSRWRRAVLGAAAISLLVLAIGALVMVIAPAFHPAPRLSAREASEAIQNRLDWQLNDQVVLLGYSSSSDVVRAGEDLAVTFYWQPLVEIDRNYAVFVHLLGEGNTVVGSRDTFPGLGRDPTTRWSAGEIVKDTIPVPIEPRARGPILLDIEAGLYDLERDERLSIRDAAGNEVGNPIVGTVKLAAEVQEKAILPDALDATFTGGLRLEGYDLSAGTPSPGSDLTLTLYWAPGGALPVSYTTLVHLVDGAGILVAQADGPPRGGRYPTTSWKAGERFSDEYTMTLPVDLPPGDYHLLVGLYDPRDLTRLLLVDGADHVRLESSISVR